MRTDSIDLRPAGNHDSRQRTTLVGASNLWRRWERNYAGDGGLQFTLGVTTEIDLLGECELADGTTDFWIEPSDECHLGRALVLSKGHYLFKLHFIGSNTREEF
jgi:hypothetical protein